MIKAQDLPLMCEKCYKIFSEASGIKSRGIGDIGAVVSKATPKSMAAGGYECYFCMRKFDQNYRSQ